MARKVCALIGSQEQILPRLDLYEFELFFVDADHTYEAAHFALQAIAASDALRFATVAVHDYAPNYPGVVRAVDEFQRQTGHTLRTVKELAILEPTPCTS